METQQEPLDPQKQTLEQIKAALDALQKKLDTKEVETLPDKKLHFTFTPAQLFTILSGTVSAIGGIIWLIVMGYKTFDRVDTIEKDLGKLTRLATREVILRKIQCEYNYPVVVGGSIRGDSVIALEPKKKILFYDVDKDSFLLRNWVYKANR